ncbi:ras association domain-containing protein 7-like isoform 2-T2 [Pholidichthys leucotaenia]
MQEIVTSVASVMELKVWVEGVVRVVSGLSLDTSCQDVVIALAQAIGQTGRYVLVLKLRGTERNLVADDCPLQRLVNLGQRATEVQFILRRTGPSLSEDPDTGATEKHLPLPQSSEPEPLKCKEPQKALTFNLGPSIVPKRTKPNDNWSPSHRASPEPQASPVSFPDPPSSLRAGPSYPSKDEVFKQILQHQRKLQDLEVQVQALERETEFWERKISSAVVPTVDLGEELEELEQRLRENEVELMHGKDWEKELQAEMEREQDMERLVHQIHSSINDQSCEISMLQVRSENLEEDLQLRVHRPSSRVSTPPPDKALRSLKQELYSRQQFEEELEARSSETEWELQAADERDRLETIEELNKVLRQCDLQQFIQKAGVTSQADQLYSLPTNDFYLNNAGIME